jgi:glycosyltransferase involved in cell wall biosynthesis
MDISVVIPVHNAASWIGEAVASVAAQRLAASQILLVDDGSTDDTPAVLRALAQRHTGIRILHHGVARGPSAARNTGWQSALSAWAAFLDADDVWHPEHLSQFARMTEEHPGADVLFARVKSFETTPEYDAQPEGTIAILEDASMALLRDNPIPQSAVVVRRAKLVEIGGYDEMRPVVEDYDLWCRLATTASFASIASATVARRRHSGQLSERRAIDMYRIRWTVRKQLQQSAFAAQPRRDRLQWEREMRALIERELGEAWRSRSSAILDAVLDASGAVGTGQDIITRYRRRRRFAWIPWRVAAGLYDALPSSLLALLRRRNGYSTASAI